VLIARQHPDIACRHWSLLATHRAMRTWKCGGEASAGLNQVLQFLGFLEFLGFFRTLTALCMTVCMVPVPFSALATWVARVL
jgi:hypothetical protein